MTLPTISVVMATFNGAEFIAESVGSVLGQTISAHEVIVVDDGSTDRTQDILARYADSIHAIRKPNAGVSSAFNRAISAANGEFVALAADDDIWEPEKLEWQREILAEEPDIDILFGHMRVFGNVEGEFRRPPGCGRLDPSALRRAQFDRSHLAAPTAVIRRSLFERIGGFREDLPGEDYEFWFRALRTDAVLYYDPRPVVRYRQHGGNLSGREWLKHEGAYDVLRDYARDVGDPELVSRILARNRRIVARHHLEAGERMPARSAFGASFRHRPTLGAAIWTLALTNGTTARCAIVCEKAVRRGRLALSAVANR